MIPTSPETPFPVHIRFAPELRLFLKTGMDSGVTVDVENPRTTVKHLVESFGVPHTEIGRLAMNSAEINFVARPKAHQTIKVFPVISPHDVTRPTILRPTPLSACRFVVDVNVGKLAQRLRMLGFDTAYLPALSDGGIAKLAESERRIVLTKDLGLLKHRCIEFGRYVRAVPPDKQLLEVVEFYGLRSEIHPFSLCLRCNQRLAPVEKEKILHRLEPKTKKYYNDFSICPECKRIYWQGSHQEHMACHLERLLK